jgi:hypothetical protein
MQKAEAKVTDRGADGVVVELTSPGFVIGEADGEVSVTVPGLDNSFPEGGGPALPVFAGLVALPPGGSALVEEVELGGAEQAAFPFPQAVRPSRRVIDPAAVLPDSVSMKPVRRATLREVAPGSPVVVGEPFLWRGRTFAPIRLYPVKLDPIAGEMTHYGQIRAVIRFEYGEPMQRLSASVAGDDDAFESVPGGMLLNAANASDRAAAGEALFVGVGEADTALAHHGKNIHPILVGTVERCAHPTPCSSGGSDGRVGTSFCAHKNRMKTYAHPALEQAAAQVPWYKISIREDGMHRLTCKDLSAAGVSLSALDFRTVKIFSGGRGGTEIPILIEDANLNRRCGGADGIIFYAQGLKTKYADANVYWLTYGGSAGKRMAAVSSVAKGASVTSTKAVARMEDNRFYRMSAPYSGEYERWYADLLMVNNSQYPNRKTYVFAADQVADGAASLDVTLVAGLGPFKTTFSLNGTDLSTETWNGSDIKAVSVNIPAGVVKQGNNELTLTEAGSDRSVLYVDRVALAWSSPLIARSNGLLVQSWGAAAGWAVSSLSAATALRFQVNGFTSRQVAVFDVTNPLLVKRITGITVSTRAPYYAKFGALAGSAYRYQVLAAGAYLSPASIKAASPASLKSAGNGADHIIVAPSAFKSAVSPLAAHRASRGMRVKTVMLEDVYDEFNGGIPDPAAIRAFLAYAFKNWKRPAPAYVVLAGGGTFDPLGYCTTPGVCANDIVTKPEENRIPAYLINVDPTLRETASDNAYVTFDGNDLPAMAIGRLPVGTETEIEAVIDKIIQYESFPPTSNRLTFVTDNAYQTNGAIDLAGDFWAAADSVWKDTAIVPASYVSEPLYLNVCPSGKYPQCFLADPPYKPYATGEALKAAFKDSLATGTAVASYIGHGALNLWAGSPNILNAADVAAFSNGGNLPVTLEMTCMTGFYHYPGFDSVAEALVKNANGGSVADWASSGFGLVSGHVQMLKGFTGDLLKPGGGTVGSAVLSGHLKLYTTGGAAYLPEIMAFHLFGDPATRPALPE